MDLSIVIINWNSGSYLFRLLESLELLKGEVTRIIVADNASTDLSELAASRNNAVDLKRYRENQGFARAANLAIGEAESRYVLLVNPDIQILPESVRGVYGEMERYPELGIACCALVTEQGQSQESFQIRSFPTLTSVIMDALFVDEVLTFFKRFRKASLGIREKRPLEVEQPAAAFWLLRKEAWSQIEGFDESFFPAWFEDVDFCRRLVAAGWKIMFFPQWHVVHAGGASLEQLSYERFIEIYYTNLLKYWKKHHRGTFPLIWLPVRLGISVRKLFVPNEKEL